MEKFVAELLQTCEEEVIYEKMSEVYPDLIVHVADGNEHCYVFDKNGKKIAKVLNEQI